MHETGDVVWHVSSGKALVVLNKVPNSEYVDCIEYSITTKGELQMTPCRCWIKNVREHMKVLTFE